MSLRLKLFLPGFGAWLMFSLLLNFYWQPNYLADQKNRYANNLQQQVRLLDKGLTENLLQYNLASVHAMLNEVIEANPEWKQIVVKDLNDKQIYPLTELVGAGEASWVTAESEISHLGEKLATLMVAADPQMMLNEQAAYVRQLNVVLLVLLAMAVFISANLQAVFLRNPLRQLAVATKRIANGEFDVTLPSSSGDEIGQLSFSFRTMSNNLKLALEELRDESEIVRQSADALRKSEERFSLAVRGSNDGIWDWELESATVFFSPRWKQMLGYELNGIDNSFIAWRNLIHPDDLGRFLDLWTKHMAGESESFYIEYRIRRKTGDYTWVLCRGSSSRNEAGHPVRVSGSQTDITERHQADAKLRLQTSALTAAADGIVITDREGSIQWVNPAYTSLTGYKLEEVLGKNPRVLKSGKHDQAFYKRLWDTILSGETWYGELWNKRKDGSLYLEEESITPVVDQDGEIDHFIAIKRDITERQQLQKQLQQAQKMEAIGQLTGGIAHDFNNMLSAVLGYTELATEAVSQYDNKELVEYLGEVQKAGSRARDLVAQMLAFSRGGEGTLEVHVLSLLITESLKMLGTTLPSSIEMELHLDNDEIIIMTNPVQIHQLVMNLCINARDAMKGKGHITIGMDRVNDVKIECSSCHEKIVGDYIRLFVRDTGAGIQPEQLDRLFEPFYTTKEVGKGTGMGLSMVHGIMHDHGGHIVVDTGKDGGTTFTLLFPVIDAQVDAVIIEDTDTKTSSNQTFDGNILIVDDEASVGRFIGELLKGCGCQVTVETDSRSALSKFERSPEAFDLVVTDQTMPGITGAELAQSLLAIRPDLSIILCTGYSDQVDEAGAEALGIRGYVSKPIETDRFLNLVKELLQANKAKPKPESVGSGRMQSARY